MASTHVTGGAEGPPPDAAGRLPVPAPSVVPVQAGPDRTALSLPAVRDVPEAWPWAGTPAGSPVLWYWDARTGQAGCSRRLLEALGLPPGSQPDLAAVRGRVHPADLAGFDGLLLTLAGEQQPVQATIRFRAPGGGTRSVSAWAAVRADDGAVRGAFGGLLDSGTAGPALRDARLVDAGLGGLPGSLAALCAMEELTQAGLWEWDPVAGEFLWTAPMYALAGLAPGAVMPTLSGWQGAVHAADRALALTLIADAPDFPAGRVETLRLLGADGVLRHLRCWSAAIPGPDSAARRVVGAAVEVPQPLRPQARPDPVPALDSVTGLPSRHGLVHQVRQRLAGDRDGASALILLDLDRFKTVNDTLGHHVGDALLVEVSRRLAALVPEGTVVARMGGDEFAVLPGPDMTTDQVCGLAATVVTALRAPYLLAGTAGLLSCPVSAGVTFCSGRAVGVEELLAEADLALYAAKDAGRDRYVVFDGTLRERARARQRAERALRSALDSDRLVLHYQPVVDLGTGRPVGAEALVRLRQPVRSAVGGEPEVLLPEDFIDVAEDTGLVVDLDCWVIDHALAELARWVAVAGPDAPWLAVNVSPRSMEAPGVVRRLLDGLDARGLPPRLLKVELTERSFLRADPAAPGALAGTGAGSAAEVALRELIGSGVPVGIDDFGTGYSALAYLQRFDLDFMKIDRSFVEPMGQHGRADAVVTAIVDLAHAHGMQVTAEGIENPRQAARLREIGCDLAQGYHFGRPVARWV